MLDAFIMVSSSLNFFHDLRLVCPVIQLGLSRYAILNLFVNELDSMENELIWVLNHVSGLASLLHGLTDTPPHV